MFHRIPPLHLLAAFEAAARLGSFARAAEELAVTPSAVSHRIKNLEELWNEELFVRTGASLRLNTAGLRYLGNVRTALEALNALARPEFNNQRVKLRLGTPPTFGRQHLVPRLAEFTSLFPHIDLELHLAIPFLNVMAEDVDLEVRFGTGDYGQFKTTLLLDETVFPACGREYFERVNGHAIQNPADLQNLTLLRSPLEPWRPWFDKQGLAWPEPASGPQFNDVGLMLEAIALNQGVGLVRARMAQRWLASGQMVRLLGHEARSPHAYYVVEKTNGPVKPEARACAEWLLSLDW